MIHSKTAFALILTISLFAPASYCSPHTSPPNNTAAYESDLSHREQEERSPAELKSLYETAELELKTTTQSIESQLTNSLQREMTTDNERWRLWRHELCSGQAEIEQRYEEQEAVDRLYYDCLHMATIDRIGYLSEVYAPLSQGEPRLLSTGIFDDGLGGMLMLRHANDSWHFELSVIRGPTAHFGEISGTVKLSPGSESHFRSNEGCELLFLLHSARLIEVREIDNCSYHRGARADFNGHFRARLGR